MQLTTISLQHTEIQRFVDSKRKQNWPKEVLPVMSAGEDFSGRKYELVSSPRHQQCLSGSTHWSSLTVFPFINILLFVFVPHNFLQMP
jgi:hypothetical protein